jgi:hypothetical protein
VQEKKQSLSWKLDICVRSLALNPHPHIPKKYPKNDFLPFYILIFFILYSKYCPVYPTYNFLICFEHTTSALVVDGLSPALRTVPLRVAEYRERAANAAPVWIALFWVCVWAQLPVLPELSISTALFSTPM